MMRLLALTALMLLALLLGAECTHLLQAGPKSGLHPAEFLLVQQELFTPAGTKLLWFEGGALLLLGITAYLGREEGAFLHLCLVALGCVAGSLAIWWLWIHPVNLLLASWSLEAIPAKWTDARDIWHTLHAIRFVLACIALAAFGWAILCLGRPSRRSFSVHLTPAMEQAIQEAQRPNRGTSKEET